MKTILQIALLFIASVWIGLVIFAYKLFETQEYDPHLTIDGSTGVEIRRAIKRFDLGRLNGDNKTFVEACPALTNGETKTILDASRDPERPVVTRFVSALQMWIFESEDPMWIVLTFEILIMVPILMAGGIWWCRVIRLSEDEILLDTIRLYFYFFQKNPKMDSLRVIKVLSGSFEFDKFHNDEIVERPSDNKEMPMLMKHLRKLNVDWKNKEKPLCYPYSVKALALLHAHFQRLDLPPNTLASDQTYIVKMCPSLLDEMINVCTQLVIAAHIKFIPDQHMPELKTIENCMKVSQMLIQAMESNASPFLQLPHITKDMLKHFPTEKTNIKSIRDLIEMKEKDRRQLLSFLSTDKYRDIINVCASFPFVKMKVKYLVLDDEDTSFTEGCIVTVFVNLKRQMMKVLFNKKELSHIDEDQDNIAIKIEDKEFNEDPAEVNKVIWLGTIKESQPVHCPYYNDVKGWPWGKKKQEGWWLYICYKDENLLYTIPVHIQTLKDEEDITLKFVAPEPGLHTFAVCLRSDCYIDFDQTINFNLDVKETNVTGEQLQFDFTDNEDDTHSDEDSESDCWTDVTD